ncbi:MAG: hypothetical protein WCK35_13775 [Chloroflexota bacterium]
MKKTTIVTLIIIALLMSMLPMSTAFAAKTAPESKITVFNHTHGTVSLAITDSKGFHYFFSFANSGTNVYEEFVPQGNVYSYYLVTRCETTNGLWNMSRNRQVELYCPAEGLDLHFNGAINKAHWE